MDMYRVVGFDRQTALTEYQSGVESENTGREALLGRGSVNVNTSALFHAMRVRINIILKVCCRDPSKVSSRMPEPRDEDLGEAQRT